MHLCRTTTCAESSCRSVCLRPTPGHLLQWSPLHPLLTENLGEPHEKSRHEESWPSASDSGRASALAGPLLGPGLGAAGEAPSSRAAQRRPRAAGSDSRCCDHARLLWLRSPTASPACPGCQFWAPGDRRCGLFPVWLLSPANSAEEPWRPPRPLVVPRSPPMSGWPRTRVQRKRRQACVPRSWCLNGIYLSSL